MLEGWRTKTLERAKSHWIGAGRHNFSVDGARDVAEFDCPTLIIADEMRNRLHVIDFPCTIRTIHLTLSTEIVAHVVKKTPLVYFPPGLAPLCVAYAAEEEGWVQSCNIPEMKSIPILGMAIDQRNGHLLCCTNEAWLWDVDGAFIVADGVHSILYRIRDFDSEWARINISGFPFGANRVPMSTDNRGALYILSIEHILIRIRKEFLEVVDRNTSGNEIWCYSSDKYIVSSPDRLTIFYTNPPWYSIVDLANHSSSTAFPVRFAKMGAWTYMLEPAQHCIHRFKHLDIPTLPKDPRFRQWLLSETQMPITDAAYEYLGFVAEAKIGEILQTARSLPINNVHNPK